MTFKAVLAATLVAMIATATSVIAVAGNTSFAAETTLAGPTEAATQTTKATFASDDNPDPTPTSASSAAAPEVGPEPARTDTVIARSPTADIAPALSTNGIADETTPPAAVAAPLAAAPSGDPASASTEPGQRSNTATPANDDPEHPAPEPDAGSATDTPTTAHAPAPASPCPVGYYEHGSPDDCRPMCDDGEVYNIVYDVCIEGIAPPACAPGFYLNIADVCESLCTDGQVYDTAAGTCHDSTTAPPACAPGWRLDSDLQGCSPFCVGIGKYYDPITDTCIESEVVDPVCAPTFVATPWGSCEPRTCPPGQVLDTDGVCGPLPEADSCPVFYELWAGGCVIMCGGDQWRQSDGTCSDVNVPPVCPVGEQLIGDTCMGLDLNADGVGQVNPDLLPDVELDLAIPSGPGPIPDPPDVVVRPGLAVSGLGLSAG